MNGNTDSYFKKVFINQTTPYALTSLILFLLGMIFSILTPDVVSKWYHVFIKLMMFMFFVMSFIFSVIVLIKGVTVLLNKDSSDNKILTTASLIISALILSIMVYSLYSNPHLIDIFGLTKKTRIYIYSPNI
jgi:hypothetical protein